MGLCPLKGQVLSRLPRVPCPPMMTACSLWVMWVTGLNALVGSKNVKLEKSGVEADEEDSAAGAARMAAFLARLFWLRRGWKRQCG